MLYVTLKLLYMIMDVIIRLRNYNRTVNIWFNIFIFSSTHFTLFTLITAFSLRCSDRSLALLKISEQLLMISTIPYGHIFT